MAKTINGSVGKGGMNRPADVVMIQYLLNCVPRSQGGPSEELALDGICGPRTNAAILSFQKKLAGSGLGWLDVGGPTLNALRGFDPYPDYQLNLSGSKSSGKHVHIVKLGMPSSSVKDPWGYYDPAGSKHMVKGYAPGVKFGGEQQKRDRQYIPPVMWKGGKSSGGGKQDSQGGKWGEKHGSDSSAGKGASGERWSSGKQSSDAGGWKGGSGESWGGGKQSSGGGGKGGSGETWGGGKQSSDASAGKGASGERWGGGKQSSDSGGGKGSSGASGKSEFGPEFIGG